MVRFSFFATLEWLESPNRVVKIRPSSQFVQMRNHEVIHDTTALFPALSNLCILDGRNTVATNRGKYKVLVDLPT